MVPLLFCMLLSISISLISPSDGGASEVQTVYDGRVISDPFKISDKEKKRITDALLEAFPADSWADNGISCNPEQDVITVIDSADGRFLDVDGAQQGILFSFCWPGHNLGENGIAVLVQGKVEALVVYSGSWENNLEALPDVNDNGLAEMVVTTGGMNMGEVWGGIAIIELTADGVKAFGRFSTYQNDCESAYASGAVTSLLSAGTGATPVFYRQAFRKSCGDGESWRQTGKPEEVALEEDGISYLRIR